MRLPTLVLLSSVPLATAALAQQPMGTVATAHAQLAGDLRVQGDHATLLSNTAITASPTGPARIALTRGGDALVCATSQFHLLHSGTGPGLLFGLDRGAFELHGATQPQDVILTPDLRITVEHAGILDLRLRVTPNGDTCIDNRTAAAPVLLLNGSFNAASYRLLPGQHVLFEHGDLRQVVDHETSNCGCPGFETSPAQPAANASPADRAAAANPFPEAQSAGLSAAPEASTQPPDQAVVVQTSPTATPIPIAPEGTATPAQPHRSFFGAIGHFFKKLFT